MFNRCKHKWEIIKDDVYPSKIEEWKKSGGNAPVPKFIDSFKEMTERTVIIILKCKWCGKLVIKKYTI